MSGRVFAIGGGKGGVGKTTAVSNLATALSAAGYDVVALDVDLGMSNLGPVLGIQPDGGPTIHNVLAGDAGISEATYETERGFSVIPGTQALDEYAAADPSRLQYTTGPLTEEYDVILLDTSAGLSNEVISPLRIADGVVLVTTPDVVAIRDAAKTGELAARVGGTVEGVVVNQAREDEETRELIDELGDEVLAAVPKDDTITMTHIVARTASPAAAAFSDLAGTLVGVNQLEETHGAYATQAAPAPDPEPEPEPDSAGDDRPADGTPQPADTAAESEQTTAETDSESGPIATAAYDQEQAETESFFTEQREEEKRASALGRLRRIFE
ncbi:MinD/ParA family ATP-binding protein [Halocatena pleomorpha]|uniref:Septum site-determining protein MinD n=1 Tax=Halocatena pleomorpha TaxID=1785090 RepID=A0A3P3RIF3_9EURY|nr:AAA family ATPase [Halocatena pleomorpha]RRJ33114.1 septum site-determining protein MinD [Halocatena pleomorpha]